MRLDKFLKVSRLVKRRTVAKEMCDAGRVTLNGRIAKAASEVAVGDVVSIRYGSRLVEVRVDELSDNPRKESAASLYSVIREERLTQPVDADEGEQGGAGQAGTFGHTDMA
ncbi:MAG: RNA-binding S4 domain-containing protein [Alicyclobacillaceae bacterium]|nr:RNA-binding S4 domain-containing protein [Alicyclobacillaceae bacterium]